VRSHRDVSSPAIIVIVLELHPHTCETGAVTIKGRARSQADLFEGSVAAIMEQIFRDGVIGDEDVQPAGVIVIRDGESGTLAWQIRMAKGTQAFFVKIFSIKTEW
jgi:hypothetical protein